MAKVVVIDDDKRICDALCSVICLLGHQASFFLTLKEALHGVEGVCPDVVFLDVRMPDGSGLEVIQQLRDAPASPEVIVITGAGDPDGAELAIRKGAWDYIQKPTSVKTIMLQLDRALRYREERQKRIAPPIVLKREGIIGSSPQIMACLDLVAQASISDANVLITGETGTGKELFARAIHFNSPRSRNRFVIVDCSALPETLTESILFGFEKGSFTGAQTPQGGMIREADQGTLFLDEVGELPLAVQKKFLRVLQERRFRPLGSRLELKSDFRVVAATNRNLEQSVAADQFRKDLLYRLRSIIIDLPPLRERPEDIRDLATFYVGRFCRQYGMEIKGFSGDFLDMLLVYHWPGNVRELRNVLEAVVLTKARHDSVLFPKHLPDDIRVHLARTSVKQRRRGAANHPGVFKQAHPFPTLHQFMNDMKKHYLEHLLASTDGNIEEACKVSGMSRSSLYEHLKRHEVNPERGDGSGLAKRNARPGPASL